MFFNEDKKLKIFLTRTIRKIFSFLTLFNSLLEYFGKEDLGDRG